ncbi:MAG: mechanosensitive ion channel [Candidatus Thermoplasmatota archaeon]|nr:mechanosensitive ion channel [Candidatus Thermoplasmatota archaeon]
MRRQQLWSTDGETPTTRRLKEQKEVSRIFIWAIVLELALLFIIAFVGISFNIFAPAEQMWNIIMSNAPSIVGVVVFVIVVKLLLDLVNLGISRMVRKYHGVENSGRLAWRFISYSVWLLVATAIVLLFVGNIEAYIVWMAVIIAAIIYALSTPIQNIAAWFMIVVSQPFKIGDIVEMGRTRGYVVDVTLNSTVFREMGNWVRGDLYTGRYVTIPNRMIYETGAFNYTKHNKFIYDYLVFSITYESDVKKAEDVLLQITKETLEGSNEDHMRAVRDAETRYLIHNMPKEPKVFAQFRDSCVELGLMYLVQMPKRFETSSNIYKSFLEAIKEEPRISIAYPHLELVRHELSKDADSREVA